MPRQRRRLSSMGRTGWGGGGAAVQEAGRGNGLPIGRRPLGVDSGLPAWAGGTGLPIRYMGTKRALAPVVRSLVVEEQPSGIIADLFCGMGSVASALAPDYPVLMNDVLGVPVLLARARFTPTTGQTKERSVGALIPHFRSAQNALLGRFARRIASETKALDHSPLALTEYMRRAPHAGSSASWRRQAETCKASNEIDRYQLATLYFSAGYFSTRQAIELDALRYAIEQTDDAMRTRLLATWVAAAGTVLNSPGHSAQYLRPSSEAAWLRLRRAWKRSVWAVFLDRLDDVVPVGTRHWRQRNQVIQQDALTLEDAGMLERVNIVYADPPYTKDHYSRFYHVHETLLQYDFPDSVGVGRYRSDRHASQFSLASEVEQAFRRLFNSVARRGRKLVLSYPSDGLLEKRGVVVREVLRDFFTIRKELAFDHSHSTLGASSGKSIKSAVERIYVCVP
jgi:adenine-specific DNA-methyltransferase